LGSFALVNAQDDFVNTANGLTSSIGEDANAINTIGA
jgi:hypothetical protein